MTERQAVCVVCDDAFTYTYRGGPTRKLCGRPACKRRRNTQNQARKRDRAKPREGTGYVPEDYPIHVQTVPTDDQRRFRPYAEYIKYRRTLRVQPDGVAVDQPRNEEWLYTGKSDPDDKFLRRSFEGEDGIRQIVSAGHGFGMDDARQPDRKPLRYYKRGDRRFVEWWHRRAGFPLAGAWGVERPKNGEDRLKVCGLRYSIRYVGDIRSPYIIPRRISRRFCSENALPRLEPFCHFFPVKVEGRALERLRDQDSRPGHPIARDLGHSPMINGRITSVQTPINN